MATAGGSGGGRRRPSGADGGGEGSERGGRKKPRRPVDLELEILHNPNLLAYEGWQTVPEPWTAASAMNYVSFPHFDRLWPEGCHEQHCKSRDTKYSHIEDLEIKWRFLTILRAISNLERWAKNSIPRCIASMMYAEHVLRKRVDWSTLRSAEFGHIGEALSARRPIDIPYSPVPQWFRENPRLVDEPGQPLPLQREPRRPRWRPRGAHEDDAMDMTLGEAFAAMEVEATRESGAISTAEGGPSLADELQSRGADGTEEGRILADEGLTVANENLDDVIAFKARISFLEARLASFGIQEDGSSSSRLALPVRDCDADLRIRNASLQAERDAAVDKARSIDLYASELFEANNTLREEIATLQGNPFEAANLALHEKVVELEVQLDEANERLARYETTEDISAELFEENGRLKKCLSEALGERKAMKLSTIMAVAKAKQYESEFESIVSEWNVNGRLRTLLLTSWPREEQMFPNNWNHADPSVFTENNVSIDWKVITEDDHHWDIEEVHDYPVSSVGTKLWSTPHRMVSDGSSCPICSNPYGPEGCYQVGSCGHRYHPQCLIKYMIQRRTCYCRAPFHPRLYLQFGLKDHMPKHWVYRPQDFPFELREYDGQNVEWSWRYNVSKVQLWMENEDGPWTRSASQITFAANEMFPNKPANYNMKLFFYQTMGWHWDAGLNALRRGLHPPFYNSSGCIAQSTEELQMVYSGLGDLANSQGTEELEYEERYHRNRLVMSAVDAILHKVSPEMKIWLEGGPKPSRRTILSPSSRPYRTRGAMRDMAQDGASSSSGARQLRFAPPLEPVILVTDSDSD
jgi:hypothetical protein